MAKKFDQALVENALPRRLGDVLLQYETSLWVGRADRPSRTVVAIVSLLVGTAFGLATLYALLVRADDGTVTALLGPCIIGFAGAAWLEQRDRRQRGFAVDFARHVLRLDFSTPIGGMPRTVRVPFELVRDISLEDAGGAKVLTVDFEAGKGVYREVLAAGVTASELAQAERVRRMLRAAVGLEKPKEDEPAAPPGQPPPVVDTFG